MRSKKNFDGITHTAAVGKRQEDSTAPSVDLTEHRIYVWHLAGFTDAEIAAHLSVSLGDVRDVLTRLTSAACSMNAGSAR